MIRIAFLYPSNLKSILHKKVDNEIAKLLRPKTALCGEIFILEFDEFVFISHPINNMETDVTTESKELTFFNVVFIINIANKTSLLTKEKRKRYGQINAQLANVMEHEERRLN